MYVAALAYISIGVLSLTSILLAILILKQRIRFKHELEDRYQALLSYHRIYQLILEDLDFDSVIQKISDIIPNELKFATGVLAILDEKRGVLKRVAASNTQQANEAIKILSTPFEKIEISISDPNNIMAKAIREAKPFYSSDVYDVLGPVIPREEAAIVQKIMSTKTTLAYPILLKKNAIGVFIASTKKHYHELTPFELTIMDSFVNLIGLALQDSKLYTSLSTTEKQLEKTNMRLEELDKLKDDFVSIASHELRTPMTAIRSYAWMALHKSDTPLSDKLERYLVRVLMSTERLISMVNDMLNVSRIESGRIEIIPEPVDLIKLVKDIVDEVYYSKSQEKNIQFIILEKPIPQALADPEKLREVLLNLVGNSLKFTPHNGKIVFDFFSDGLTVEVIVKDTGMGISKEDLGRLFQKFGRLDSSYVATASSGGTGLGLFISKKLIELMYGKIWARSDGIGKGSTFTVSLPIATKERLEHIQEYKVKAKGEAKALESVAI